MYAWGVARPERSPAESGRSFFLHLSEYITVAWATSAYARARARIGALGFLAVQILCSLGFHWDSKFPASFLSLEFAAWNARTLWLALEVAIEFFLLLLRCENLGCRGYLRGTWKLKFGVGSCSIRQLLLYQISIGILGIFPGDLRFFKFVKVPQHSSF